MEQEIIKPIDKEILKSELIPDRQLRMTNKSHNEIYVITAHNAPNVMKRLDDCVKSLFVKLVEEREKRWISMSLISVRTAINS